ncbi:sulfurtransferase [bacterium]|nr:MAG: sulfurtransferase [bacterium]
MTSEPASPLSLPPGPLVTAAWLADHLHHPDLRVVDIRGKVLPPSAPPPRYVAKRNEYDEGHVDGAVFVDWTTDIVDADDPVPAQIARPDGFRRCMERLGIGDDTRVVVYDDYSHMFAGRLHWALRYYGHDAVRILEGGVHAWKAAGFALTTEAPKPPSSARTFTPRARPGLRRTADEVAAAVARGALLIDARGVPQFTGEVSAARRKGHIPTARNVPYPTLLTGAEGAFKPAGELRDAFAAAGVDVDALSASSDASASAREVIVYCNGGVSATVPMTALALLGVTNVALYDGSWNEWGNDDTRPLETA